MGAQRYSERLASAALAAVPLITALASAALPPGTIHVRGGRQLFLDDRFTADSTGLTLTVNNPVKSGERLIVADQPWESHVEFFGSVMQEPSGELRMFYEVGDYSRDLEYITYAASTDGITWTKPVLGLIEDFNGSTENNILIEGTAFAKPNRLSGGTVWTDPLAGPDQRYKFNYLVHGAHSADGIHWSDRHVIFTGISGDTCPVVFWDDRISKYVVYHRHNVWDAGLGRLRRTIVRAESDDYVNWSPWQTVMAPGPTETTYDFYNSAAAKYPWADDAYIMLPSLLHYGPTETLDIHLGVSRDGVHWTRPGSSAFIPRGAPGEFDSHGGYAFAGLVRQGDEIWIYFTGTDVGHGTPYVNAVKSGHPGNVISRAVMRLDGFTSLDAGAAGGMLTTWPLTFSGGNLLLNVRTEGDGFVEVELFDGNNPDIRLGRSETISGDSVNYVVRWQDGFDLAGLGRAPALVPSPTRIATDTWDADGVNGWKGASTLVHHSSGGVGDSGYVSVSRTGVTPTFVADGGANGGAYVGDLDDTYGDLIRVSGSLRHLAHGGSGGYQILFKHTDGGVGYWIYRLEPAGVFYDEWTDFEFDFSTAWDDIEAVANGWIDASSLGFSEIWSRVDQVLIATTNDPTGTEAIALDNFSIAALEFDSQGTPVIVRFTMQGAKLYAFEFSDGCGVEPPTGDLNGDCRVDDSDLSLLLANWGPAGPEVPANLNGDDYVDDDDLSLLLANWTTAEAVPEPAMALPALGGLATLAWRRRDAFRRR